MATMEILLLKFEIAVGSLSVFESEVFWEV